MSTIKHPELCHTLCLYIYIEFNTVGDPYNVELHTSWLFCQGMNPYMSDAANGTNTDGSLMSYWEMWQHIMDVQWVAYLWVYGCIFAVMAGG